MGRGSRDECQRLANDLGGKKRSDGEELGLGEEIQLRTPHDAPPLSSLFLLQTNCQQNTNFDACALYLNPPFSHLVYISERSTMLNFFAEAALRTASLQLARRPQISLEGRAARR